MEILEKIKTAIADFEDSKKNLLEELQKDFHPAFMPLFDKHPKITSIGWAQYTPYFNDSDTCEFSARVDDVYLNGEHQDDVDSLDWRIEYYLKGDKDYKNLLVENPAIDMDIYNGVEEFKELLQSIPEYFLKDLFGDHVLVTISRDGIEKEDYEHD